MINTRNNHETRENQI